MFVCLFVYLSVCLIFLHLHKIVEGLYFHCSLSVCLCVCVSVRPALLVNKILAQRMNRVGRGFRLLVAYRTSSNTFEIGDIGIKVKVTMT